MSTSAIIRHRRGTAAEWTSANPILEAGQLGYETDTLKYKFGDGVLGWNALPYPTTAASVTRGATWAMTEGGVLTAPFPEVVVYFPRAATIRGVNLLTKGGAGSCELDILTEDYSTYLGTPASIVAAAPPEIVADVKYNDTTLTGWTTAVAAGAVVTFQLVSSSTFSLVTVVLDLEISNG